jgi:hypothetical protein
VIQMDIDVDEIPFFLKANLSDNTKTVRLASQYECDIAATVQTIDGFRRRYETIDSRVTMIGVNTDVILMEENPTYLKEFLERNKNKSDFYVCKMYEYLSDSLSMLNERGVVFSGIDLDDIIICDGIPKIRNLFKCEFAGEGYKHGLDRLFFNAGEYDASS